MLRDEKAEAITEIAVRACMKAGNIEKLFNFAKKGISDELAKDVIVFCLSSAPWTYTKELIKQYNYKLSEREIKIAFENAIKKKFLSFAEEIVRLADQPQKQKLNKEFFEAAIRQGSIPYACQAAEIGLDEDSRDCLFKKLLNHDAPYAFYGDQLMNLAQQGVSLSARNQLLGIIIARYISGKSGMRDATKLAKLGVSKEMLNKLLMACIHENSEEDVLVVSALVYSNK